MLKKLLLIFILVLPFSVVAESQEVTMTPVQAVQLAGQLVDSGKLDLAQQILTQMPPMNSVPLEIERWFLLAQISQRQGDIDTAIKIYRKILDDQPNLARVRFELAVCYMHQKKWRRADYHLRLAMAGGDLPDNAKQMMNYYRYVIRQNKNWNVWFNFGAAPDNNVNNSVGGSECVMTMFGLMCRDLAQPESAIGSNFSLGGNYEFKLSDNWRWKSDANIYTNIYDKHDYDDLYLSLSTGPRYVWRNGDMWLAGVGSRRWYGWDAYNWSAGVKLDTNYDFTRKLSGGLYLRFMENTYDEYGDILDGQTYSANTRLTYSFNASVYATLRTGIAREVAKNSIYSYWAPSLGIGVGAELPWGFHVYAEPSVYWSLYDDPKWVVKDSRFKQVTERDFTHRYSVSLSNNKLDIWGFVPTITVSYTKRESNIWQREYDKTALEFSMQQRF
ncbi:MAG: surface lipoprotein assembly modifier [Alphaproteobacteria bacterium]|nr:surface lipoprotein assembly modifier [Alphaproteobacteria bacterium]